MLSKKPKRLRYDTDKILIRYAISVVSLRIRFIVYISLYIQSKRKITRTFYLTADPIIFKLFNWRGTPPPKNEITHFFFENWVLVVKNYENNRSIMKTELSGFNSEKRLFYFLGIEKINEKLMNVNFRSKTR